MPLPFPHKKIPNKVTPCPIMDSSVEVRFELKPKVPMGAVFGILYSKFQDDYSEVEELPILQFPENLRQVNPDFTYQPHYRIKNKRFVVQIGPQVMSIGCIGNYPGWNVYKDEIIRSFSILKEFEITNGIVRLGLRYINFFQDIDIFEKLDVELLNRNSFFAGRNSFVRTEFIENELTHILQVGNSGNLTKDNVTTNGSLIDIDVSRTIHLENFFENVEKQISNLHDAEKQIFFGLLDEKYLDTFNPTYD